MATTDKLKTVVVVVAAGSGECRRVVSRRTIERVKQNRNFGRALRERFEPKQASRVGDGDGVKSLRLIDFSF